MSAKVNKGFAVYDGRGVLIWGTLRPTADEAESHFRRWNAVDQFPADFAGWTVRPVTIQAETAKRAAPRCKDTADMFTV